MSAYALKSVLVGGIGGIALAATAVALGGSGANGIFNLGADNTVDKTTTLRSTASFSGPQLQVKNTAGGAALDLQVNSGKPPFTVNVPQRVQHLNADRLDGTDSNVFLRGGGTVLSFSRDVPAGSRFSYVSPGPVFGIDYDCPPNPGPVGGIAFDNYDRNASVDLFVDRGGTDPVYANLGPATSTSRWTSVASAGGDFFTFRATWTNGRAATIRVASIHRDVHTCYVQAQAVITR